MKNSTRFVTTSLILAVSLVPLVGFASEITGTLSTDPNQTMIQQGNQMQAQNNQKNNTATTANASDSQVDKEFIVKLGLILIFAIIVIALGINTFSPKNKPA
jgi:hypothetical protein